MTREELLNLPPAVDVVTAGRALGISRNNAYEMIKTGRFPVRVLRLGKQIRVPTADLRKLLGLDPSMSNTAETAAHGHGNGSAIRGNGGEAA